MQSLSEVCLCWSKITHGVACVHFIAQWAQCVLSWFVRCISCTHRCWSLCFDNIQIHPFVCPSQKFWSSETSQNNAKLYLNCPEQERQPESKKILIRSGIDLLKHKHKPKTENKCGSCVKVKQYTSLRLHHSFLQSLQMPATLEHSIIIIYAVDTPSYCSHPSRFSWVVLRLGQMSTELWTLQCAFPWRVKSGLSFSFSVGLASCPALDASQYVFHDTDRQLCVAVNSQWDSLHGASGLPPSSKHLKCWGQDHSKPLKVRLGLIVF